MRSASYRYELRRGDEIIATGHLPHDTPLEVGDRITIGTAQGIVREIDPILGESESRLVVQLIPATLDLQGGAIDPFQETEEYA